MRLLSGWAATNSSIRRHQHPSRRIGLDVYRPGRSVRTSAGRRPAPRSAKAIFDARAQAKVGVVAKRFALGEVDVTRLCRILLERAAQRAAATTAAIGRRQLDPPGCRKPVVGRIGTCPSSRSCAIVVSVKNIDDSWVRRSAGREAAQPHVL